jgi:CheY-like chemotaxis protein
VVTPSSLKPQKRQIQNELDSGSFNKTLLLVDDSEATIIAVKDILRESGYKLLFANNGKEALKIIDESIPDGIILDLLMPGVDGFEVLKTIREAERTAHIPVLILTAKHITKEELIFLKQNHIHQLIQKGDVNSNELISAIDTMVFPEIMTAKGSPDGSSDEMHPNKNKPVVLVVEDNPDNMTTVKAILDGNYTVIEATNGISGVEMARKHKPDLILMDIDLPKMDGIAAFKMIRKDTALQHIPVIALTASAMIADRETILAHGIDAYIPKPIDEKVFFKTINEVLYGK